RWRPAGSPERCPRATPRRSAPGWSSCSATPGHATPSRGARAPPPRASTAGSGSPSERSRFTGRCSARIPFHELPGPAPVRTALEICFWVSVGLIVWTQLAYAAVLALLARVFARGSRTDRTAAPDGAAAPDPAPPSLSLIVAAHDEEPVIGAKVRDSLALDYPRERLELIVACDGCSDATARLAREEGADVVL